MTIADAPDDRPILSVAKQAEKQRLAAALRENLKRRKAQMRLRTAAAAPGSASPAAPQD